MAAAVYALVVAVEPNRVSGDVLVVALAAAMGLRNAVVRRMAIPDLTTTVLTMTLTGLTADPVEGGSPGGATPRRVVAVLAMLSGAVLGALLIRSSMQAALAAAGCLATAAPVIATRARERP
jgi:uncharacterized membrane protein YoaK (UPF0700 family)